MKTILYTLTLGIGLVISNQLTANSIPADTVGFKIKKHMNLNSTKETDLFVRSTYLNTSLAPISEGLVKNNASNNGHQAYYLNDENADYAKTNSHVLHKQVLYKSGSVNTLNWNDTLKDEIVQRVFEQYDNSKK